MRLRGRTIGAMNMFRRDRGALGPGDVEAAQALSDVATIVIIQHQAALDAQTLNEQLQQALNSRIIIEQAKGKMSESLGISMDEAFHRLRQHARRQNLRLTTVAEEIATGTMSASAVDPLPRSADAT